MTEEIKVLEAEGSQRAPEEARELQYVPDTNKGDEPLPGANLPFAAIYQQQIASQPFPEKSQEVLREPVSPLDVEIRPDGIVYLPHIKYRERLNRAFGAGAWGLVPMREPVIHDDADRYGNQKKVMVQTYALFILGRFVSSGTGQHRYEVGSNMLGGDIIESVKSDALGRCCKDIGIASELWDETFRQQWKKDQATCVWVSPKYSKGQKLQWRRKDRNKLEGETSEVSPEDQADVIKDIFQDVEMVPSTPKVTLPPREVEGSHGKCPECGHNLVQKQGKWGPWVSCSNYPACRYKPPKIKK